MCPTAAARVLRRHWLTKQLWRGGILVLAFVLAACARDNPAELAARPAVVERPLAVAGLAQESYAGEVRARHESRLGFRVAGKVASREVDLGDRIRRGQVLATLEPQDLLLQVDAARAALAAAQADESLAKVELDRHADLLAKRYVSQGQYDARRNSHQLAVARRQQARSQLAVAENQAGYTTLRATADGVVTELTTEVGQVVAAGSPVLGLAHEGEREVLISVPEQRVAAILLGMPVQVEIWATEGARFAGRVREVAAQADPRTRTYDVRVAFEDPQVAVKLGMTARVHIATGPGEGLQLPLSALHEKNGLPAVWVLDPKTRRVVLREVTLAGFTDDGVNLLGGIHSSDWVVTAGVHTLVEGQVVRPIDRGNRAIEP